MKKRNFFVGKKGRLNPFADEDGYTDGLGDAPQESVVIADFLPPPDYMRRHFGVRIVSDEQAARENAEAAARKVADVARRAAREIPTMPVNRPYPKPQYALGEAMMLRDSAGDSARYKRR